MTIKVKQYDPPVEKTYISPDVFIAVDQESDIALRVVNGDAQLVSYDSRCAEYNPRSFNCENQRGFDVKILENLLESYNNRGS